MSTNPAWDFSIFDPADNTKKMMFSVASVSAGNTRTLSCPDASGTLPTLENDHTVSGGWTFAPEASAMKDLNIVTVAGGAGLSNGAFTLEDATTGYKAEIAPSIAGFTADRIITLPDSTDTLVTQSNSSSLNNKTMGISTIIKTNSSSSGASFSDTTTATKRLRFVLSGSVGNNSITVSSTTARNYTLPDADITLAGSSSALTSTRVPFVTAGGLLTDDSAMTFAVASGLFTAGKIVSTAGFGCNGKTAQTSVTVSADSTDLASVITLCNQLRGALIANGICV